MQEYIGCSGWSYSSWDGHFYPKGTESKNYLEYYSKVFDYVEIDSTFYRIPDRFSAIRWTKLTPDNFKFTAKFPGEITHEMRLESSTDLLNSFFDAMRPLKDKTLALLLQLPPSLKLKEGFEKLEHLIPLLAGDFRYALEVRHSSWFDKKLYKLLAANNICLAWSQLDVIRTPPEVTTDFVYIRFIGDRSIDEKEFGKIRKDRVKEMEVWASRMMMAQKKLKFGIVAANNHYAGFGPGTANTFRTMLGLEPVVWDEMKQARIDS